MKSFPWLTVCCVSLCFLSGVNLIKRSMLENRIAAIEEQAKKWATARYEFNARLRMLEPGPDPVLPCEVGSTVTYPDGKIYVCTDGCARWSEMKAGGAK